MQSSATATMPGAKPLESARSVASTNGQEEGDIDPRIEALLELPTYRWQTQEKQGAPRMRPRSKFLALLGKMTPQQREHHRQACATLQKKYISIAFGGVVASIILFMAEDEMLYQMVFDEHGFAASPSQFPDGVHSIALCLQCLFSFMTLLTAWAVVKYYTFKFDRWVIDNLLLPKERFSSNLVFLRMVLPEVLFLLLHVPPGIYDTFQMTASDGQKVVYNVRVLNVIAFMRLYMLFRFQRNHSRTRSDTARVLGTMYGMNPTRIFSLKDFLYAKPTTIIATSFVSCMALFAYLVMIFERPARNVNDPYPDTMNYGMSFWFVWAVMTTVGLGDVYPITTLGRAMTICASGFGMILSALLIGFVSRTLELSRMEDKMLFTLNRVARRKSVPFRAASVIQAWWRRQCGKTTLQQYSHVIRDWILFRQGNGDLSQAFDSSDLVPQVQDLHADVRNLVRQVDETQAEQIRVFRSVQAIESRARRTWAVIEAMADNVAYKRRTKGAANGANTNINNSSTGAASGMFGSPSGPHSMEQQQPLFA